LAGKEILVMTKTENRAWYYWWNPNDEKWYILAFVNGQGKGKGSCSLRRWEAKSGDFLDKEVIKDGHWQDKFAGYLHGTSFHVHLRRSRINLKKDCIGRLPQDVLSEIREEVTQLHISLSLTLLDP
jgi:hypothetical protein